MSTKKTRTDLHDAAARLGSAGGKKGGPARARKLSAEERHQIAEKAAKARWAKKASRNQTPRSKKK